MATAKASRRPQADGQVTPADIWLRGVLWKLSLDERKPEPHEAAAGHVERAHAVDGLDEIAKGALFALARRLRDRTKHLRESVAVHTVIGGRGKPEPFIGKDGKTRVRRGPGRTMDDDWLLLSRPRSGAGRPPELWLDALCRAASAEGFTPMQMARAGVDLARKRVFERAGVNLSISDKGAVGVDPVESLRQRLDKHWPRATKSAPPTPVSSLVDGESHGVRKGKPNALRSHPAPDRSNPPRRARNRRPSRSHARLRGSCSFHDRRTRPARGDRPRA